jgi:hypothetical protein
VTHAREAYHTRSLHYDRRGEVTDTRSTLRREWPAVLSAMPLYIELLLYPDYFITNNLIYQPDGMHWAAAARQVFYNVEILLHPHRWYNDFWTIPHVSSVRDFNPVLIDRLAAADGNLVLIEGSPHRDLDSDATRRTERTPFDGDFVVELVYPARRWLLACAVLTWLAGAALLSRRT